MLSLIKASFLLATLAGQGASSPAPKDVAIVGARIEVGDGHVIPNGVVLIHNGRISAVGESVTIPAGVESVDVKGATLFPGFIDAYTTDGLKLPDAPPAGTPPDSRNTAPATMWHANKKGIRTDVVAAKCLDLKARVSDNLSQGIVTALLAPGGGTVRGIASVVDYTESGTPILPSAGAELSFRGGSGAGYPGTLFGIVATLRQTLADAQTYARTPKPATKDEGFENLKPAVTGQIPMIFAVDTAREIVRAARVADEFGSRFVVAGGREAYRNADFLKSKNAAVIVSLDPGFEPSVKPDTGSNPTPVEVLKERHDLWAERNQNVVKLAAAGVPVAFTTSGISRDDFLKNVRRVIGLGLPREAALTALTSGAATILGVSDKVGTIAPGKLANLVLMSGDFANEKSEVLSVFVEGKKVDVKKEAAK